MTFELSADEKALQQSANKQAAEHIAPIADAADRDGTIPEDVCMTLRAGLLADTALPPGMEGTASTVPGQSAQKLALVIQEWAAKSGAVAASVGLSAIDPTGAASATPADHGLPGLRGLGAIDEQLRTLSPVAIARARVVLAAVAVGIGRAALDEALAFMRASGDRPGGDPEERPHWVLADAAAELDGARLLTSKAAQAVDKGEGQADASLAKVFAADVAQRAVDAALRILGPPAYRRGTVTERLTRDARAIALVGGTGEEHRAFVASATLPA